MINITISGYWRRMAVEMVQVQYFREGMLALPYGCMKYFVSSTIFNQTTS